ncbi:28S ribosomal protein S18b, mitochondrial [Belonocnema kinseyi]|uniref:28S ribosomal protein S18b, mitochondrial n=1 Tax=Belonocnema kinseyi TaxID=2817044 RepID=UPI00143D173C|nr:28S ribosomal protein S18b, mitochondrial [Belonocnema kinseyi]
MSILITNIQAAGRLWLNGIIKPVTSPRAISRLPILFQIESEVQKLEKSNAPGARKPGVDGSYINIDRTVQIPVETSIKYVESEAYKITYGEEPVWKLYRRNFKGQFAPRKTRKTCIRGGVVSTGNPCPICRDEYLVLDHRNTKLLNQFISPFNGETLSYHVTHICQRQHKNLLVAIQRAKNYGTITYDPPHRSYNYSHWYKPETSQN